MPPLVIMKMALWKLWYISGLMTAYYMGVPKCTSYHKATVEITRSGCCTETVHIDYLTCWDLRTLCVS